MTAGQYQTLFKQSWKELNWKENFPFSIHFSSNLDGFSIHFYRPRTHILSSIRFVFFLNSKLHENQSAIELAQK